MKYNENRREFYVDISQQDTRIIRVSVYQQDGGMNYFTGTSEVRGIALGITPLEITGSFTAYTAFTGSKTLLKENNRFSKKQLKEVAEIVLKDAENIALLFVNKQNDKLLEQIRKYETL